MSRPATPDPPPEQAAVLAVFDGRPAARLSLRDIASGAHLEDPAGTIEDMVAAGLLWPVSRGRYVLPGSLGMARGSLRVRASGYGTVATDGGRVVVPPAGLRQAIDGDLVLVRITGMASPGEHRGVVAAVLRRTRSGSGGVLRRAGRGWVVDPLDPSLPRGIRISGLDAGRAAEGSVVWGRFVEGGTGLEAVYEETLGGSVTPASAISAVVRDSGFRERFPAEVIEEAARSAARTVTAAGREDARSTFCITVDPVDARDFDDSVSVSRVGGGFELGVHIADVASYVDAGSLLDREAMSRGTSVYLPDRVIPMLPESLSTGSCSLIPGEDRLARSVFLSYDGSGVRRGFRISGTVIRSSARLSYEEALASMSGDGHPVRGVAETLEVMKILSGLLDRDRERRGALDFGSEEYRIHFDASGMPARFERVPDDESHRLIENFMIEANRAVAEHCTWAGLRVLFRVHGEPGRESASRLREDLADLGVALPGAREIRGADLARILAKSAGIPAFPLVREAVLRSLQKAVYDTSDLGHFGLALRSYLHFTSPIRRYPDLLVHRVLESFEAGDPGPPGASGDLASHCSSAEQAAEDAERECTELMALMHLEGRKGIVLRGVVSAVHDFGCFVRLADLPVDGLVPARMLRGDDRSRIRPGSPVSVQVLQSDPGLRQLTLGLLPERGWA